MAHDLTLSEGSAWYRGLRAPRRTREALIVGLLAIVLWACVQLESRFAGLDVETLTVGETPVTLYRTTAETAQPLVVVAHGFGGSRQMMDQISVTLARSGFSVAAFDFPGHGRHPGLLSPDVERIEGTTSQLVEATVDVTRAMGARADTAGPIALVGHSMATDVVIRAAQQLHDVGGVAAISMYSEAITATDPQRLLILSGEHESHLRNAGLRAIGQIDPDAGEGVTVFDGDVTRRSVVAPGVGHVGVLYSTKTLDEIVAWLTEAAGISVTGAPDRTGWIAGMLLAALALLAWPLSYALPSKAMPDQPIVPWRMFLLVVALPIPVVAALAFLIPTGLGAIAGILTLAGIFGGWGLVQLIVLWRGGFRPNPPDGIGTAVFLFWGLVIFAVALDRYGAAFLPTGPRLGAMALMLLGTVPLMLADRMLSDGAPIWRRVVARLTLILALGGAMALNPTELGLTFTVLPVLALFFLVYGSIAQHIANRRGAGAAALGSGIALAWAVAASTPLFAVSLTP